MSHTAESIYSTVESFTKLVTIMYMLMNCYGFIHVYQFIIACKCFVKYNSGYCSLYWRDKNVIYCIISIGLSLAYNINVRYTNN